MTQMMKGRWAGLVMLFVLCAMPLMMTKGAQAADANLDFTLKNRTGFAITSFFLYPATKDAEVGEDWLDGAVIPNGGDFEVAWDYKGVDYEVEKDWEFQVFDKNGRIWLFSGLKLAELTEIKLFYKNGICKAKADNGQELTSKSDE